MPRKTHDYKNWIDYQEAASRTDEIYFGSAHGTNLFFQYVKDVFRNGEKSAYFGQVLCPDRPDRSHEFAPNQWTYEKNQAFWAGIIDNQRPLLLTNEIRHYGKKINGTISEVVWLMDNGYRVIADPSINSTYTWFIPPEAPVPHPIITYYTDGSPDKYLRQHPREIDNENVVLDKFAPVRKEALAQIEAYDNDIDILIQNSILLLKKSSECHSQIMQQHGEAGLDRAIKMYIDLAQKQSDIVKQAEIYNSLLKLLLLSNSVSLLDRYLSRLNYLWITHFEKNAIAHLDLLFATYKLFDFYKKTAEKEQISRIMLDIIYEMEPNQLTEDHLSILKEIYDHTQSLKNKVKIFYLTALTAFHLKKDEAYVNNLFLQTILFLEKNLDPADKKDAFLISFILNKILLNSNDTVIKNMALSSLFQFHISIGEEKQAHIIFLKFIESLDSNESNLKLLNNMANHAKTIPSLHINILLHQSHLQQRLGKKAAAEVTYATAVTEITRHTQGNFGQPPLVRQRYLLQTSPQNKLDELKDTAAKVINARPTLVI